MSSNQTRIALYASVSSPSSRPQPREREYRAAGGSRGGLGRKFGVGTGEQKQSHRLGASLKHQRTHCEFLRLW